MLSDAKNWSSSTGHTLSGAPPSELSNSPPSPSDELTEIEKLAVLVRKIVQQRSRLEPSEDDAYQAEMKRGNEARLNGGVPFNQSLPRGRSAKHPIFREDSTTSSIEYTASKTQSPQQKHDWLDGCRTRTLCSEPAGLIHGTWPRNCRGHVSRVGNADPTVTNHRKENLTVVSKRNKSDLPPLQVHALSEMDDEHEISNSVSKLDTKSRHPRIVEITVTKLPRINAFNTFQGPRSKFQTRNSINSPPIATNSCSAPKYQPTGNADSDSVQARCHFDVSLKVNNGLTTLTEDAGDRQESRDNNNNSVSPRADISVCQEDRSRDPVSVSASLIITFPFVSRARSIDNPYRRMICKPAVLRSSTRSPLRRTMSEESRRNADRKTGKHGPGRTCNSLSPQAHTKPPIHRRNSCLAAFGHTCLPISKNPKVNASNNGRSWYEGV